MNADHQRFCSSPEWAEYLRGEMLPRLLAGVDLGEDMLELGPGPGGATELLRQRVRRLTALEVDATAADALAVRFAGGNVTIIHGDCVRTGLPDASFDAIGTFTMLHHIPTDRLQYATLAEAFRMLRSGGVLIGSDSLASDDLHHFHVDDTYNPVEPAWLVTQLLTLGFHPIAVTVGDEITFTAHKPRGPLQEGCAHEREDDAAVPPAADPARARSAADS
jgi:SAM-dependent methyltransferase